MATPRLRSRNSDWWESVLYDQHTEILLMTSIVRIEHGIQSFDAWKRAFDSDPLGRQNSGVRRYRILRPTGDPNYVMIDLEFDSSSKAQAFHLELNNFFGSAQAQKVMNNPRVRVVEAVESMEY